jgi:hypothetical protein
MPSFLLVAVLAAGCGGSSSPTTAALGPVVTVVDQPVTVIADLQAVPPAQVKTWPGAWCDVHVGMTPSEVAAVMGAPTEAFPDQMSWYAFQYGFGAFFDVSGRVRQLDINEAQLSSADRAAIPCDGTRQ